MPFSMGGAGRTLVGVSVSCVGLVRELWRYPVKSFGGERLAALDVDQRGVVGDRLWALVDQEGKIASGKDTRRFRKVPGLLQHSAALDGHRPLLRLADGRQISDDAAAIDAVAEVAGPGWRLRVERQTSHLDDGPVHLVTTATLARLGEVLGAPVQAQRLRPNLVIETPGLGFAEDTWVGRTLKIGDVELVVQARTERCAMVSHAQRRMERRPDVLKAIGRSNEACAGVYAEVAIAGRIALGSAIYLR